MIVSDPARTWNVPFGIGYHSSYECADAHSVEARSEAIVQFRHHQNYAQSSQNRLWPLQKHSLAAESHTTAHDADKDKLEAFSRATMAQHDTVKLSFRDVMVNKGDASKFGRPGAARRSVLDKAMVTPSILTCTKSKGLARQFGARRLLFVDGSSAARLDCSIGRAVVNIQPNPKERKLIVDITFGKTSTVIFSAPIASVQSVVMDLEDGTLPGDTDGVVNVTFVFASKTRTQVLSVLLCSKDVNTCRNLVNLPSLKRAILDSTVDEGKSFDALTKQAKLVRAVARDLANAGSSSSFAASLGDGWAPVTISAARRLMPGLCRVDEQVQSFETKAKQTPQLNVLLPIFPDQMSLFKRCSAEEANVESSHRVVNCCMEEEDRSAMGIYEYGGGTGPPQ